MANFGVRLSGEQMALPCAQNVEVIHLDLLYGLSCGFQKADVEMAGSDLMLTFYTQYLSQGEIDPVGSGMDL